MDTDEHRLAKNNEKSRMVRFVSECFFNPESDGLNFGKFLISVCICVYLWFNCVCQG